MIVCRQTLTDIFVLFKLYKKTLSYLKKQIKRNIHNYFSSKQVVEGFVNIGIFFF